MQAYLTFCRGLPGGRRLVSMVELALRIEPQRTLCRLIPLRLSVANPHYPFSLVFFFFLLPYYFVLGVSFTPVFQQKMTV
ncbi:MAG: hypothetical protein JW837_12440, partial [Sedimentisphaerales bacterium]|nr:hypothetical protein [Sedimentisphaerales bacterium]